MSWTYEIALRGLPEEGVALRKWFVNGPQQAFAASPGLATLDLYTPAQGPSHDPYNHDGAGPLLMVMLEFATRDALAAAVRGATFGGAFKALPSGVVATGAAFERLYYPVGDGTAPAPLQAPFSYVVRYHRPADDEAAFIRNYLDTHPVTQAKLPGIRSILCYLPLDDVQPGNAASTDNRLSPANYMIGNEVVFDDIAAFNGAMASPVRQELRQHFHEFPRFSGANTHYPMERIRLFG
jgi:hypothetical protein